MPGMRCAVFGCNHTYSTKKASGQDIIFHAFPKPKDLVSKTIRSEWINMCKRKDKFNPETSRICSVHFVKNDYERDLRNELLGLPLRMKLKKTAVPTVGINNRKTATVANLARSNRHSVRMRKREVLELDVTSNRKQLISEAEAGVNLEISPRIIETNSNLGQKSRQDKLHEEKYEQLLKKYKKLRLNYKTLSNQLRYYKAKSYKNLKSNKSETALTHLKKVLADNQVALIIIQ